MIYLDHCATTPMSEEAMEAYMKACRSYYGNEQSLHDAGDEAKQLLDHCRNELSSVINGRPEGMYFTTGGSDSNITALSSLAYGNAERGKHIITSPLEHPSVYQALDKLKTEGFEVDEVDVHPNGQVDLCSLEKMIREDTVIVSICHASSETGVIQPLEDIRKVIGDKVIFHSDAVQTFAKIPMDVEKMGVDAISFSGHKVYGPKNSGGCYLSPGVSWKSVYPGVTHQNGFTPGTVDVPGVAAMTTAALALHEQSAEKRHSWKDMQDRFLEKLDPDVFSLLGDHDARLPHHLALSARGFEGQWIMLECNRHGIAISSGSACKSTHSAPPNSLIAMGHSAETAHGLFRISFGKDTTWEELEKTADLLQAVVKKEKRRIVQCKTTDAQS